MGKRKNKKVEEGLPGWFATYSDMMTLLFAFFVLLFSLSTIDRVKVSAFQEGDKGGDSAPVDQKKDLAEIKEEFKEIIKELDMEGQASVTTESRGVAIEINGDLCFESMQATMKPTLIKALNKAIDELFTSENDFRPIIVEGHTDSDPLRGKITKVYPTNWELSSARAAEVVKYLILKGVNSGRLSASGYADRWPAGVTWQQVRRGAVTQEIIDGKNATKDLKRKNRRIKIIVGPHY